MFNKTVKNVLKKKKVNDFMSRKIKNDVLKVWLILMIFGINNIK